MAKFISDEEMQALETKQPSKKFISDADMEKMDKRPSLDPVQVKPEYNALDSAAASGLQGYVGGFADEGLGALSTAKELLTGKVGLSQIPETYRRERDTARQAINGARSANPLVSTVAGVGGAIASPLNKLGPTAQLAVSGLGESNADLTKGEFKDAGLDTLKTVALGKAFQYGANKVAGALPAAGDKMQAIASYLKGKQPNASPAEEIFDPFTRTLKPAPAQASNPIPKEGYGQEIADFFMGNSLGKTRAVLNAGAKAVRNNSQTVGNTLEKVATKLQQSPQMLGRFAKPLQEAQKRGASALAATHFLLSQQEPDYRKITDEE